MFLARWPGQRPYKTDLISILRNLSRQQHSLHYTEARNSSHHAAGYTSSVSRQCYLSDHSHFRFSLEHQFHKVDPYYILSLNDVHFSINQNTKSSIKYKTFWHFKFRANRLRAPFPLTSGINLHFISFFYFKCYEDLGLRVFCSSLATGW